MINISLVFVRKSNSNTPDFSLLGLNNISNIEILKSHKFVSAQPLLVAMLKDKITAIYLISSCGKINQIFGIVDYLNEVEEIFDLTGKFLKTYNTINYLLLNTFKSLSPEEIITFKKELNILEEKVFSNYVSNDIPFEIIKRHISKDIRKTNLTAILKSKMLSSLSKSSMPMKNVWNKKIDIDLEDYEIKINSQPL
jgi:hypothetical protein